MSKIDPSAYGGALKWVFGELGGPVTEVDSQVTVTNAPTIVVDGNGERVALIIENVVGTIDVFLALSQNLLATGGIQLFAGGGSVTMSLREDFTLPTRRWYGQTVSVGSTTLYIVEYIRVAASILK